MPVDGDSFAGWVAVTAGVVVVTATLTTLSSSGCGAGIGLSCELDSDCSENQICADEQCTKTCTTDEDCLRGGYVCQPYIDANREESVNVCLASDVGVGSDGGEMDCTSDEECRQKFGENARCGIQGNCIVNDPRHGLLIRDTTPNVEPGNPKDDSGLGADIAAVFLIDSNDDIVGRARAVSYEPANGIGGGMAAHFDGSKPMLDMSEKCIAGAFDGNTTSLGGEGGSLLVDFVDEMDEPVQFAQGYDAVVIEWGQQNCGAMGSNDEYDVLACVSQDEQLNEGDCGTSTIVESAKGYSKIESIDQKISTKN